VANPFDGIDVESNADPTLVDVNGDGKDDLVVGNYAGNIKVWMNSGSNTWPTQATGVANPFDGIDAGERSAPTLVDVNGDGKDDLVVGNYAGNIKLYFNSGSNTWPTEATGVANPFDEIDVGSRAAPTVLDLKDGTVDLVVGNTDGNIKVWRNGWCEMLSTPQGGNLDELCTSATSGRCESVSGGYGGPRECSCSPGYATNGIYPGCSMCESAYGRSLFQGKPLCLPCPAGEWNNAVDATAECAPCDQGFKCEGGANDPVKCHNADTPAGSATCTNCLASTYPTFVNYKGDDVQWDVNDGGSGDPICEPCEVGYAC
jgi:hypothetical protein